MTSLCKIGMIGLDTSHATAFTELLHNKAHPYHVPGGVVVAAYPGGSADFELSRSRVGPITDELREHYGVKIVHDLTELAEQCDAILLESVDGRVHLQQFQEVVRFQKPVFIDKPFALCSNEAMEMIRLADAHGTPLMSCSALRYSEALTSSLSDHQDGGILGCDTYGPMRIEETQPGLFWYGIHCVEVLFTVLGKECVRVRTVTNVDYDMVVGEWANGQIGTVRGNRKGNQKFGTLIHCEQGTHYVDISACEKPFYASMLENILAMFVSGKSPCDIADTERIVRFIECANESRRTGLAINL
ncbi:Gfo/Idh/MocA family protein [Alicyclobacillus fodiniaquatilis]|uniref:Gfo/Idh/MocA family protein n=1 Tax=Alicyclobacillus fodiniaquatilis TaxID=1661150 RepID=A0ABW4JLY3_9BACL